MWKAYNGGEGRDRAVKINEVEAQVGITKKNIRFYEEQGLLSPPRGANGYREYGEAEVETLRRIRLMRKLGVPLEEIRRMQAGEWTDARNYDLCLNSERLGFDGTMEAIKAYIKVRFGTIQI